MRVHARAVLAEQRLGHERRVQPVLHRVFLDRDPVRHAVVGHLQRVGVAHVDLVLAGADLVVGVLGVDPELLERQHRLAAQVRAGVERRQVEVAAVVEHLGRLRVTEVEVLELGADVEVVEAHLLGALERAAQHVARIALVRRPLGRQDVAEHPPDAGLLGTPRQPRERRRIGLRDHVGLLDRVEAGDRRAVEAHPALERVRQLGDVDRERLQLAEDVGEPEADEPDLLLRDDREDVVGGKRVFGHRRRHVIWRRRRAPLPMDRDAVAPADRRVRLRPRASAAPRTRSRSAPARARDPSPRARSEPAAAGPGITVRVDQAA